MVTKTFLTDAAQDILWVTKNNTSDTGTALTLRSARTSNSGYSFIEAIIDYDETPATAFLLRGDGRVGIGTASPNALLDVRGDAIFNEDGGDYDFRIEGDTDANLFFVDASQDNIGIGKTPAAAYLLDVDGKGYFADNVTISGNLGVTDIDASGSIHLANYLYHRLDTDTYLYFPNGTGDKIQLFAGNVNFIDILEDGTQDELAINEGGGDVDFRVEASGVTDALFVRGSDGNVGIGVTSPGAKLEVGDGVGDIIRISGGGATTVGQLISGLELYNTDGSADTYHYGASFKLINTDVTYGRYSRLGIFTGSGETTEVERVTILNNGNVGIGTDAPGTKLDVNGDLTVRGGDIHGANSEWIDIGEAQADSVSISNHLIIGANDTIDDDTTIGGNADDWISFSGFIEMKSNTDSYGIVLRDKDTTSYLGLTQVGGYSYLSDSAVYSSYFIRGNGSGVHIRGQLNMGGNIDLDAHWLDDGYMDHSSCSWLYLWLTNGLDYYRYCSDGYYVAGFRSYCMGSWGEGFFTTYAYCCKL